MKNSAVALLVCLVAVVAIVVGCGSDKGNGPEPEPGKTIVPLNGVRFKGTYGSLDFDKPVTFAVRDEDGNNLADEQILVSSLEGDGSALPRSISTDASGVATLPYVIDGDLGHAVISLYVPDHDTLTVYLRADVIIPGPHGQVSYVLLDDDLAEVKQWLGEPDSYDVPPDPQFRGIIANYEPSLGIVVELYDLDDDNTFYDTSSVSAVYILDPYTGTTLPPNPVGIGSTLDELRTVFGGFDALVEWSPDTVVFQNDFWGLTGWAYAPAAGDSIAAELHFKEFVIRPDRIVALDGLYSRGSMGGSVIDSFVVLDLDGFRIGNVPIYLERVEGDGTAQAEGSPAGQNIMTTNPAMDGIARYLYQFDGSLGHALLRLVVPDVDTIFTYVRANTLIPGPTGQAQYVLFGDTYDMVRNFNGDPAVLSPSGQFGGDYLYADYSGTLGIVVALHDSDGDQIAHDTSGVYGVIAESNYSGTTAEGIGIASTMADLRTAYGPPESLTPGAGDTVRIEYTTLGILFDAVAAGDTTVARILMAEDLAPLPAPAWSRRSRF